VETQPAARPVTLRCSFCGTLNQVDAARAASRPKCGECARPMLLDRPFKVAEEDFQKTVLESSVPVLVDFYADWCGPCKLVAPLVDEIAREQLGQLLVVKIDTDRAPGLSQAFGIRSIPTVIVFKGGTEVGRSIGFEPEKVRALARQAVV